MLTPEGATLVATSVLPQIEGGVIVVSDGRATADAPISSARVDGTTLVCEALFGEQDANFEWKSRVVQGKDGKRFDAETADMGRKAGGSEWTCVAVIDFLGSNGA